MVLTPYGKKLQAMFLSAVRVKIARQGASLAGVQAMRETYYMLCCVPPDSDDMGRGVDEFFDLWNSTRMWVSSYRPTPLPIGAYATLPIALIVPAIPIASGMHLWAVGAPEVGAMLILGTCAALIYWWWQMDATASRRAAEDAAALQEFKAALESDEAFERYVQKLQAET